MKKIIYLSLALIVATATLPSCNKKLKKELEELDKEVTDLKSKNEELQTNITNTQNSINTTNQALGANEPIISSGVTYNSASGNLFSNLTNNYFFKADDYSTQYIEDYQNGTYYIYIERFKDVDWNMGAGLEFEYNGSTVGDVELYVYDYYTTGSTGYYSLYFNNYDANTSASITLNSINLVTGDIDVQASGSSTALYTGHEVYDYGNSINNYYYNAEGGTASTTLSFKGKLAVFKN